MEDNKTMFYIVAIVAVVAIFGMVFMAISANSVVKTSSLTEDSAGQPIRVTVDTLEHTVEDCISKYSGGGTQGEFSACVSSAS